MEPKTNGDRDYFLCYTPGLFGILTRCGKKVHHTLPNPKHPKRIMWAFPFDDEIETIAGLYVSHSGEEGAVQITYDEVIELRKSNAFPKREEEPKDEASS